jgi:hypothetical protein
MLHRDSDLDGFIGKAKDKGNEHGIWDAERKESIQEMFADTAAKEIAKYS